MPFQIVVKLHGFPQLFGLLENPANTMYPATTEALEYVHGRLTRYKATSDPRQPPGSRYVRTFDLKNAQKIQQYGGTRKLGRVYSKGVDYDRYVIAEETQAQIHRDRWYTYESTAVDELLMVSLIYTRFWVKKFAEI